MTTWGELNEARDNAILITTWYSGTHQIWRDVYVGAGPRARPRAVLHRRDQPDRQRAVRPRRTTPTARTPSWPCRSSRRCASATTWWPRSGCCASTSASSACSSWWAARWAPSRPTSGRCASRTRCCAPRRSPAPRRTPLTTSCYTQALWSSSGPTRAGTAASTSPTPTSPTGIKRHAHIWAVMGFSTEFWKQEVWRALEFESKEAFLEGFLEPYFLAMDPNDLLTHGLEVAARRRRPAHRRRPGRGAGRITAKTFVIPIDEDMFFPPRDCRAEQELIPGQRAADSQRRARPPRAVRRRTDLHAADRPVPGRAARHRGLTPREMPGRHRTLPGPHERGQRSGGCPARSPSRPEARTDSARPSPPT